MSVFLIVILGLVACAQKTPEQQVAEARSKYRVELNTFRPEAPEPVEEMVEEIVEGAEATAEGAAEAVATAAAEVEDAVDGAEDAEEGAEGDEEVLAEPEGPRTSNIFFDLLVQFDGTESLDGLTVDITQADAFEQEKATYRYYLETGPMVKSELKQMSFVLEDIPFETGDLFSVELREVVPAEEQGEYKEFADAAAGG